MSESLNTMGGRVRGSAEPHDGGGDSAQKPGSLDTLDKKLKFGIEASLTAAEDYLYTISDEDLRVLNREIKRRFIDNRCGRVLYSLNGKTIRVTTLNIDVVNSSENVRSLSERRVGEYYEVFIENTSDLIQRHGGYVLKNAGDSVIGIFPCSRYYVENHDKAVLCGLEVLDMIGDKLNTYLVDKKLPSIACRISADFGFANVLLISSIGGYSTVDLFGGAMNSSAKISRSAKPNQMVIGENLLKELIGMDRLNFRLIRHFGLIGKHDYPVYLVERKNKKGGDVNE